MKIVSAILIFCLFASGCALHSGSGSFDAFSGQYGADAQAFAAQAADELGQRHAPAQTPIALQRVPGLFGDALENHLRVKGFALVAPDTRASLGVKYRLDILENVQEGAPLGYVQISCTDGQLFSFSRTLSELPEQSEPVAPYTEPPNAQSIPDEYTLKSRPLPDPEPMPRVAPGVVREGTALVRTAPVRSRAKAAVVARRSGIGVADFCRWNDVRPDTVLAKGHIVYLSAPPAPVASASAPVESATANAPLPSVSAAPSPAPKQTSVYLPTPAQTSPALTLEKAGGAMPVSVQSAAIVPAVDGRAAMPALLAAVAPTPHEPAPPVAPVTFAASPIEPITSTPIQETWSITPGGLRGQLHAWTVRAGYQLVWKAEHDYVMESHAGFQGDFVDAMRLLFSGLASGGHALRVTLYEGNKVVEVTED